MLYELSRQTEEDGPFYRYGTYDMSDPRDVKAMACAVFTLAKGAAIEVRVKPVVPN